jgi:hypothetical protein
MQRQKELLEFFEKEKREKMRLAREEMEKRLEQEQRERIRVAQRQHEQARERLAHQYEQKQRERNGLKTTPIRDHFQSGELSLQTSV